MITIDVAAVAAADAADRLARGRKPVWLTSPGVGPDSDVAKRHFVACDPVKTLIGDDDDAIGALQDAWQQWRRAWGSAPPTIPIAMGYLTYELGRSLVRVDAPARVRDASGWPGFEFRFFDAVYVVDQIGERAWIHAVNREAAQRLLVRLEDPKDPNLGARELRQDSLLGPFEVDESEEAYGQRIGRITEYLRAGDVYQVNLARRLTARLPGTDRTGLGLAQRLAHAAPAPHGIWMADAETGRFLLGNSPERFLGLDDTGTLQTSPIKGTRPRSPDRDESEVVSELLSAEKDRAEHVMIVDLERNDLGRVCETGSVHVSRTCQAMALPTLYHMVSTVTGRLRAGVGLQDLLRATFPGGSVTGAPKRRAMQIIDELETVERGPYTGATGWLGAAGDLDLALAIRTAAAAEGRLVLWVGGGIVIDSDAHAEFIETEIKARAFRALCCVESEGS